MYDILLTCKHLARQLCSGKKLLFDIDRRFTERDQQETHCYQAKNVHMKIGGNFNQKKYLHSWCDIFSVAKR